MEIDHTSHRYIPNALMVVCQGTWQTRPIISVKAYPPGSHPQGCPIVTNLTAVECRTTPAGVRWFGCNHAYIDSSLKMVVVGHNHDEIRRNWKLARE